MTLTNSPLKVDFFFIQKVYKFLMKTESNNCSYWVEKANISYMPHMCVSGLKEMLFICKCHEWCKLFILPAHGKGRNNGNWLQFIFTASWNLLNPLFLFLFLLRGVYMRMFSGNRFFNEIFAWEIRKKGKEIGFRFHSHFHYSCVLDFLFNWHYNL